MRILLAGAAGFIGSHLTDRLLGDGHSVIGVDSLITGSMENVAHLRGAPGFRIVEADVCEPLAVDERVDYVMNLASPASPKDYMEHPVETLRVGSEGTRNLLEYARRQGAGYLLASTSECYGDPLEHPQKETYWGNVNPNGPRSCYDEAKRFAEAMTMAYRRTHGVKTSIVRIFNTYGPRMKLDDGRVAPSFMGSGLRGEPITVYGDGTQTRSFCYVSDLVEGIVRLAGTGYAEPVNIGNPQEMTVMEFARAIEKMTGTRAGIVFKPLPEDDPKRRQPDITRAREVLGWEPKVDLETGLRRTVEYFRTRIQPRRPG
ncbi:MAG: NAD-dependent dehydratase [Candidatus Solibacter sp.]|nr:NAD-dependent dehydratase [Candidatus Solibacter sp.]